MSEGESGRSSQWWRDVERHVDAAEAAYADGNGDDVDGGGGDDEVLPDPWSGVDVDLATLTDEQAALLAASDDQPPVLRFTDDEGPDDQPPRPRLHP